MKQITRPKRIIVRLSAENDARLRAAADASKRTITDVVDAGAMREVKRIEAEKALPRLFTGRRCRWNGNYRKDYLLDLPEISEDSPLKDEAYTCECGSVHFHIRRDGKMECASCLKDVEISSVKFGASDE